MISLTIPGNQSNIPFVMAEVRVGDTWDSLAVQYSISLVRLLRLNGLSSADKMELVPGTFVFVMVCCACDDDDDDDGDEDDDDDGDEDDDVDDDDDDILLILMTTSISHPLKHVSHAPGPCSAAV
jgi:hypothetical protein